MGMIIVIFYIIPYVVSNDFQTLHIKSKGGKN